MELRVARLCNFTPAATAATSVINSDTLFGAVCNAVAEICSPDTLTTILEEMRNDPAKGFVISSAFPFADDTYAVPLLGKELFLEPKHGGEIDRKWLKKCYVKITFFSNAELLTEKYLVDPDTILTLEQRPRNRLSRKSDEAIDFFSTAIARPSGSSEKSGFWIAYNGKTVLIEAALKYLMDEGIGGDRSVGLGHFTDIEWTTVDVPNNGNHFVNLSLYVPTGDELDFIKQTALKQNPPYTVAYKLIRRQGWAEACGGGKMLKPARLYFAEGGIFPVKTPKKCYGMCDTYQVITIENHPVWWSGVTLPLYFTKTM